jgi:hypothetical protein
MPANKRTGLILSAVAASLLLAACSKQEETPTTGAAPDLNASEGQVDIVAWAGYIERGETDKAYDWVTQFEKDTGCKVNVTIAGTSDEMVSLMTEGSYDLVTASGDASLRLIRGNTVQPIDIAKVPGYATIDKRLQEAPWHYVDGKHYGVPYQWGPNVLVETGVANGPALGVGLAPRNSDAWGSYFSLDLRAGWLRALPKGVLQVFGEIDNATNHSNNCCVSYTVQSSASLATLSPQTSTWLPRLYLVGVTWQLP